jgi:hypothetical protein
MREPTAAFQQLFEVFNIETKRQLEAHCRNLVVHQRDLTALILAGQNGILHPYRYANHFEEKLPPNLVPSDAEREALTSNGVGQFKTKGSRKFASKIFQLFRQRRSVAAHLFYTPDRKHWYLFYFDNRDTDQQDNHWKCGPHVHLVCSLWPNLKLARVCEQVCTGEIGFPSKLHLRYRRR